MKRILQTLLIAVAATAIHAEAFAWGREGHASIAYIAELNLTPRAKANIEKCIDGHSIVYYASWLDQHRSVHKEWGKRRHTCDFNFENDKPVGKPLRQMRESLRLLADHENLTDSARKFHIYALVHTMGDFHCPGHIRFRTPDAKTVLRHTKYDVRYMDEKEPHNFHHILDVLVIIDNHADWGYMDYGHVLNDGLSQERKDAIVAGTLEEWLEESARSGKVIYDLVPRAEKGASFDELPYIGRDLLNELGELANSQILKAGLRLAKVINDIFDK